MIKATLEHLPPETAHRLIKNQEQINQLHRVFSVLRLDKQNALVRRLVRKTQDGTLGQPTADTGDAAPAEGDEMSDDLETDKVNFGDVHNNYTVAQPATAKSASLWPMILAATLGGCGLGAAAMALPALLKPEPQPTIVTTDTDTQYSLEFSSDAPANVSE